MSAHPDQPEPPSHLDLLAAARSVRRAAVDGGPDAVHAELSRLREALLRHLDAEREPTESLPGTVGRVIREGQQRLARVLDDLLRHLRADDACTCIVRAAEVDLLLRRQARLERTMLRAGRAQPPRAANG